MKTHSCKCQLCDALITFESAQAGTDVDCPHCGALTRLFIPVTPAAAQRAAARAATVPALQARKLTIEEKLDSVGTTYFSMSVVIGVLLGCLFFWHLMNEQIALAGADIFGALFVVGHGYIVQLCFHAAAEHIRLMRKGTRA